MKRQQQGQRRPRSDATFWADGTSNEHCYWGPVVAWWWRLAGWKRKLPPAAAAAVTWGLLVHRAGTEWVLAVVLGPAAGVLAVACFRRLQAWEHYRAKVRPLACAVAPVLDQPVMAARSWVHVPQDYATREDAKVVIDVPDDFTGASRDVEDITRAVTVKLGLLSPAVACELDSRHPRLVYARSAPPPLEVTAADILGDIRDADASQVILGLGAPRAGVRQVVSVNVNSETPHAAASMTTGDGKTRLAMNYAAQLAYRGALLIILDYKWFSHMWADGLPNVCYARTPEQIHQVLCWLGHDEYDSDGNVIRESELTRRKKAGLMSSDEDGNVRGHLGHRILVIAEEQNSTVKALKRYWRRIGGRGTSPALDALEEVGTTGRQLLVNNFYIAQRLSAKASGSDGSADARENIGAIITKDPTEATWKMLAGGHAQPPSSGHPGRYQLILRKEVREFQGALWTPKEAREFAASGVIAVPPPGMPFASRRDLVPAGVRHPSSGGMEAPDLGLVTTVPAALDSGGTVKLADMVAAGLFVSIAAARRRSTRDPLWPRPAGGNEHTGYTYAVTDVYEYLAAKGMR